MKLGLRPAMRGALLLSILAHGIAVLTFVEVSRERQAALAPVVAQSAEAAIEVEILADPRMGAPETDGIAEAEQSATPATDPPAEQAAAPVQQSDPGPPDPEPSDPGPPNAEPAPSQTTATSAPEPPSPAPPASARPEPAQPQTAPARPAQPAPARTASPPPAPRQPPVRARDGSGAEGREDGTTDIVIGPQTVPAGPDPSQYNLPPRYPREAAQRGQQGVVRLLVLVATDGSALSVDVAESSGFPLLDRAAREAVAKWRFRPGRDGGLTVPSTIPVTLSFVLEDRR